MIGDLAVVEDATVLDVVRVVVVIVAVVVVVVVLDTLVMDIFDDIVVDCGNTPDIELSIYSLILCSSQGAIVNYMGKHMFFSLQLTIMAQKREMVFRLNNGKKV